MITKKQASVGGATLATAGTTTAIALTNKKDGNLSFDDNEELSDHTNKEDSDTNTLQEVDLQYKFTVLSLEDGFSNNYSNANENQTLGGLYGGYFVGTYGSSNFNKDWWDESYKVWEKDKDNESLSNEFGKDKVDSPFVEKNSQNSNKALNKVCEDIYKKKKEEIKFENYEYGKEGDDNGKKLIRDTMKYCSPMRRVPKTVEEDGELSYETGSFGLTKKNYLASVNANSNNVFWKLRNDDFFRDNSNYWSGSLLNTSKAPEELKSLNREKSNSSRSTDMKATCAKSYPSTSLSADHSNQYVYYCSWSFSSQ